jgi:hypothetical protein
MLKEIHLAGSVRTLFGSFSDASADLGSPSSAKRRLRLQEPDRATLEKSPL